jgi:hypothetical protein
LRTKTDHKAEGEEAFVLAQRNENHDNVWLLRKKKYNKVSKKKTNEYEYGYESFGGKKKNRII